MHKRVEAAAAAGLLEEVLPSKWVRHGRVVCTGAVGCYDGGLPLIW